MRDFAVVKRVIMQSSWMRLRLVGHAEDMPRTKISAQGIFEVHEPKVIGFRITL
jgi:hypothetical protein